MANQNASNQGGNFPLDNLCYDLITIIHEKSKALEAYDKYLSDAQNNNELRQLLEQIRQQDTQQVQQLKQHLGQLLGQQSGSTSSQSAGQTRGGL
jgi:ferritin-like metal-binding protein YciE